MRKRAAGILVPVHFFQGADHKPPTEAANPGHDRGDKEWPIEGTGLVQNKSCECGGDGAAEIANEILHADPPPDHAGPGQHLRDRPAVADADPQKRPGEQRASR